MRNRRHGTLARTRHAAAQHLAQRQLDTQLPHMEVRTQVQGRHQAHTHLLHPGNHGAARSRTRLAPPPQNMVKAEVRVSQPLRVS